MQVPIPARRSGSLSLIETYTLLAICRIVEPKRIFEIGTFQGSTTRNLARNNPQARITTLDVDTESFHLDGEAPETLARITRLRAHSWTFDYSGENADLVFVDGGHDGPTVKCDTASALKIVSGRGAIVWHDYRNPAYPELTAYLESLDLPIYHIEDTMLCVHFRQPIA